MRLLLFWRRREKKFEREMKSTKDAEMASKKLWKKAFEDETFSYEGLILGLNRIIYGRGRRAIGLTGMTMRYCGLR